MKKVLGILLIAAFLFTAGNVFAEVEKSATTAPTENAVPAKAKKVRYLRSKELDSLDLTAGQQQKIAALDSRLQEEIAAAKNRKARRNALAQALEKVRLEVLTDEQREKYDRMTGKAPPATQPAQDEN